MPDVEFHNFRYRGDSLYVLVVQSMACVDDETQIVTVFRRVDDALQLGLLLFAFCISVRTGV